MIKNFNRDLIPAEGKIVVGLSGGADSMAILHNLLLMVDPNRLVACHYDHKWVEQETADAAWVQAYCQNLGIPVVMGENNTGNKTETGSRALRYAFFEATCSALTSSTSSSGGESRGAALQATCIVLGHHLDDQCETLLYRLARGTGIEGMAGIAASRELYEGCNVLRPMLRITKDEIVQWCEQSELKWITDMTNFDTTKCRGLIRHEIMPRMVTMNPCAKRSIGRLAQLAAESSQLIDILMESALSSVGYDHWESADREDGNLYDIWKLDYQDFIQLHPLVRDKIWIHYDRTPTTSKRMQVVREALQSKVGCRLKGGWELQVDKREIVMLKVVGKKVATIDAETGIARV